MKFCPIHHFFQLLMIVAGVSGENSLATVPCQRSQFRCKTSGECLHDRFFCDKIIDCKDKSDELLCLDRNQDEYWNVFLKKRPDADREKLPDICIFDEIPPKCSCKAETFLLCRDQSLTSVPDNIAPNVTYLDISGNDIYSISKDIFYNLTQLREILFMHSNLNVIEAGTLENCQKLLKIYLTDNKLKDLPGDLFPVDNIIEEVRLTQNRLEVIKPDYFQRLNLLKTLHLEGNLIETIVPGAFVRNIHLQELFLDRNNLEKIDRHFFSNLSALRKLSLSGNRIHYISSSSFISLEKLTSLSLAENLIEKIYTNTFVGLQNLTFLELRRNRMSWIEDDAFKPLVNLNSLNLEKNDFRDVHNRTFAPLVNLKYIYLDAFYMCGAVPKFEKCFPQGDGISSQHNLLENQILRVTVWIVAILACFGNVAVLLGRFFIREDNQIHSFFIKNLSFADFVMGLYLIVIAAHDVRFRGNYLVHDNKWRNSWGCDVSGMLSTISSEVSVLTLTLITLDRYMCITYPLSLRKRNIRLAYTVMALIWTFSLTLVLLPVMGFTYFGNYFYRNNAVCIPLLLHEPWSKGWEYSAFMFLGLNLVSFSFITYAYCSMFASIRQSKMLFRSTHDAQERCLMKRFSLIVLTDFVCWMPIICLKVAAFGGLEIGGNLYSWVVIFVLPVNSALNPLLYTLTTKLFKQTFCHRLNTVICGRRTMPAEAYSTYSISKFRYSRRNTQETELESLPGTGRLGANSLVGKMKYKYSEGKVTYIKGNGPKVLGYCPVSTGPT